MKLTWLVLAVFLTLVPVAGAAANGNRHVRPPSAAQDDSRSFSLSGRIVSVDYAANQITVRSHGQDVAISLTPTTGIERHGDVAGIGDLRRGAQVQVSGTIRGGAMIAESIRIK